MEKLAKSPDGDATPCPPRPETADADLARDTPRPSRPRSARRIDAVAERRWEGRAWVMGDAGRAGEGQTRLRAEPDLGAVGSSHDTRSDS